MLEKFTGDENDPLHPFLSEHQNIGVILYPDGGCDQSTGAGGWGVHGYFFTKEVATKGSGCPSSYPTADGYTKVKPDNNITILAYFDFFGSVLPRTTNNVTELVGLIRGIEFINIISRKYNIVSALALQDSQYAIKCAQQWAKKWEQNKWIKPDGEPVANIPILQELIVQLNNQHLEVKIDWVKGHSGVLGNELADGLATNGKALSTAGELFEGYEVCQPQGYWKDDADYNSFFRQSTMTFVTNCGENVIPSLGVHYYHFANLFKDSVQGERHAYNGYSVVFAKEPDPVFQKVIAHQNTLAASSAAQTIVEADLGVLLNKRTYSKIYNGGERFFATYDSPQKLGRGILSSGNKITGIFNPPLKAFSVLEIFSFLHESLMDFITSGGSKTKLTVTEITDHLYEPAIEKKPLQRKLKKEINASVKHLPVTVNHGLEGYGPMEVRLVLETDLPSRNVLAAISEKDPKVFVITWTESHNCARYATIITSTDTNAIYCGPYSNTRVLCR